jgi:hypothetical protein
VALDGVAGALVGWILAGRVAVAAGAGAVGEIGLAVAG